MGSRSFFESWDSNRPNVINFINIGGSDAKKFVVQSVGRGVRIETLPNQRRRFARLPGSKEQKAVQLYHDKVQPPETLFLFATNRSAIKAVLEGLETEKATVFEKLEGFEKAPMPKIGDEDMLLLVPEYRETQENSSRASFSISEEMLQRFKEWLGRTSDSVFVVRDGLAMPQIVALRGMFEQTGGIQLSPEKNYAMLAFLQHRLMSHISRTIKVSDGVRKLDDEDIVHFREIRVHSEQVRELQDKINKVKQSKPSQDQISWLAQQLANKKITLDEFNKRSSGEDEAHFKDLTIKKLLGHYYLPVVLGNEKAHYIQHIIKAQSEIEFLDALGKWTEKNDIPWDAWMFSKIDESVDNVHIPYYDTSENEYRRFLPDFVFWMCKGNEYRVVFVDPKGTEYTSAYRKIDGYQKLFMPNGEARRFKYQSDPMAGSICPLKKSWDTFLKG